MESLACVDVPALPLQVLVGREPTWRVEPVAVVDHDAPHGVVRWTNERARRAGVLSGLRYASALSLCAHLRAATVEASEVEAALERITTRLRDFTPEVEPSRAEPGVFWANLAGLGRHGSRVRVAHGSWFSALPIDLAGRLSVVVSNPPYVAPHESLPAEVAAWEPERALVAERDGFASLEILIGDAPRWLRPGGALVLLAVGARHGEGPLRLGACLGHGHCGGEWLPHGDELRERETGGSERERGEDAGNRDACRGHEARHLRRTLGWRVASAWQGA